MPIPDRNILIHRLTETRSLIEKILPDIDVKKEIYPGWTISDLLAHMTGWDDVTIDALRAHVTGRPPSAAAIHSLDIYNDLSISSRKGMDFEHVLKEWRLTRQVLCDIIEQSSEDKLNGPVIVPWGGKPTITELVEIFYDHENGHAQDILEWLKHPDRPILKEEN